MDPLATKQSKAFKTMVWSRIVRMDQKVTNQDLYYNIVKDLENVDGEEQYDPNLNLNKFKPHFDPKKYAKENQPLQLDSHKLDDEKFKEYALTACNIRQKFMSIAKEIDDQQVQQYDEYGHARKSRQITLSRKYTRKVQGIKMDVDELALGGKDWNPR